jgi:hypothetical protein
MNLQSAMILKAKNKIIGLFFRIQEKFDFMIYWLAFTSLNRMLKNNIGFVYYMELSLRDWRKSHVMSKQLKHATEDFYKELWNVREN